MPAARSAVHTGRSSTVAPRGDEAAGRRPRAVVNLTPQKAEARSKGRKSEGPAFGGRLRLSRWRPRRSHIYGLSSRSDYPAPNAEAALSAWRRCHDPWSLLSTPPPERLELPRGHEVAGGALHRLDEDRREAPGRLTLDFLPREVDAGQGAARAGTGERGHDPAASSPHRPVHRLPPRRWCGPKSARRAAKRSWSAATFETSATTPTSNSVAGWVMP